MFAGTLDSVRADMMDALKTQREALGSLIESHTDAIESLLESQSEKIKATSRMAAMCVLGQFQKTPSSTSTHKKNCYRDKAIELYEATASCCKLQASF